MIPDLCDWVHDLARWLPPLPAFLFGDTGEGKRGSEPSEETTMAPATAEALARAREAFEQMNEGGAPTAHRRPLDARFRSAPAPDSEGGGVHRLIGRLLEIDVDRLPSRDREALMGAASGLVERLRQSSL